MKTEDKYNMRALWDGLLHVYGEFAKVCKKNGLRYFVGEGNAIGALRNKGFIPWDDDFDVLMPRLDYERFKQICAEELPPYLKFLNYKSAPEFQYTFGKVQDTRREIVMAVEEKTGLRLQQGIYIDILVVDGVPNGCLSHIWWKLRLISFVCQQKYRAFRFTKLTGLAKMLWCLGACLAVFHPGEKWPCLAKRFENFMKSYPLDGAKMSWRDGATLKTTMLEFPASIWAGVVEKEYDSIKVPLPIGYDDYLRIQYGDYMTPPPPKKCRTTHIYEKRCPWWLGPSR